MCPHRSRLVAVLFGLAAASAVVLHGSHQAFGAWSVTDEVTDVIEVVWHPTDGWASRQALTPGSPVHECVTLTLQIDQPVSVRLHADTTPGPRGDLGGHMTVEIVELGPDTRDCAGFRPGRTLFDGPLAVHPDALTERHGPDRDGLAADFRPQQPGDTRSFRITYQLDDSGVPQGWTTNPTFTWRFE